MTRLERCVTLVCLFAAMVFAFTTFQSAARAQCESLCVGTACWKTQAGCLRFTHDEISPNKLYSTVGQGDPGGNRSQTADIKASCDAGCKAPDATRGTASANCGGMTTGTRSEAVAVFCET